MRTVTTHNRSPALAIDDQNRIVAWNRASGELLGFQRDEVEGRLFGAVISARDAFDNLYSADNAALHAMALKGEPIHPFTLAVLDADGIPVSVVVLAEALVGRNPSAYYLVLRLWPERRRGLKDQLAAALLRPPELADGAAQTRDGRLPAAEPQALTLRQREVLRLLAHGRSSKEVAQTLSLSVHTVHNHCRNILARLHVHNQAEAVAVAMRQRWI